MPIYEYACTRCGTKFEKLVRSMSKDKQKVDCPKCGSDKAEKSLSAFAVSGSSSQSKQPLSQMCGRCGGAPGSCMADN